MDNRKLILVKHSKPLIQPQVPSAQWPLSDEGRRLGLSLAGQLRPFSPSAIIASEETKALETAQILAGELGLQAATAPNLHEHDRSNVPHLRTPEFISSVALFFQKPSQLVFGRETAQQAQERFSTALRDVLGHHSQGNLVVVAHGTVISLLIADRSGQDPFPLWRQMGLPSYAVLSLPDLNLLELIPSIT